MNKTNIHYPIRYGKYNKYNAKKTEFMGFKFDSKWEAERYGQLASMQMAGVVQDLKRQVKFDIIVNDIKICKYIADFVYTLVHEDGKKEKIVEDAKGVQTTDFKIKMKLMKAVNNIEIKISKKK
jgi:hypothetical protein|tara:strand:- start:6999 stop:7370 length:372 start_codon:yes stop_codon:yes gene_type:complete